MSYQMIIFMTKKLLMAVDINENGNFEAVSIDGNTELEYKENFDIDKFFVFLKDAYNINQFSELDISILLIKCGANETDVNYIKELLISVSDMNVINAKKVLPLIVTAQGGIKKNCVINVNILNAFYQLEIDEKLNVVCNEIGCNTESKELTISMFEILCNFSAKLLISGDEELKKKDKENKRIQKKLKKEYEEQILKLKEELRVAKNRILELEKSIELKPIEIEEKKADINWSICCFEDKNDIISQTTLKKETIFPKGYKFTGYEVNFFVEEGSIVEKNEKIGGVFFTGKNTKYGENCRKVYEYIQASTEGKIFYLVTEGERLVRPQTAVAIIGNAAGTKEDAKNWYESINRREEK